MVVPGSPALDLTPDHSAALHGASHKHEHLPKLDDWQSLLLDPARECTERRRSLCLTPVVHRSPRRSASPTRLALSISEAELRETRSTCAWRGASRVLRADVVSPPRYTPAYAIYEGDTLARAVLFNYVSDATGANDVVAVLKGFTVPASVSVKYLRASTVSEQYDITW